MFRRDGRATEIRPLSDAEGRAGLFRRRVVLKGLRHPKLVGWWPAAVSRSWRLRTEFVRIDELPMARRREPRWAGPGLSRADDCHR